MLDGKRNTSGMLSGSVCRSDTKNITSILRRCNHKDVLRRECKANETKSINDRNASINEAEYGMRQPLGSLKKEESRNEAYRSVRESINFYQLLVDMMSG